MYKYLNDYMGVIKNNLNVNDKISLLKEKIKNIDDIFDIISSECFVDNEYIILFSSLDYFEIALIIAYIPDIFSYVMCEEKWQIKFNEYFLNLKPEIQNKIKEVSRKISFWLFCLDL